MSDVIAIDTETFWSKKLKYSVRNMIVEQYASHHMFECFMVSACNGEVSWSGSPADFNWASLEGKTLVSHNARFDRAIITEMIKRGQIPNFTPKDWLCTADLTAYLSNRRALDMAVEYLYKVKLDKTDRADSDGKHWTKDFSPEQQKSMLDYARRDAEWCHKLWTDHGHKWPLWERRLSRMTADQGIRGVQIDTALLDQYLIQTHEMRRSAELHLPWLQTTADAEEEDAESWDEIVKIPKPTSTKCIAEACRRSGIPACPVKSDDEEAYDAWENLYAPAHPWIRAVTAWRSINKLYKTFELVKARLRPDGTMPFALKYMGAHTGRWSGDAKINMQNQRKKPVICNQEGLLELDEKKTDAAMREKKSTGAWPSWVKYAVDFRHLIVPRPGTQMVVSDLSQIEPRVLAWLSGNQRFLDTLRDNPGMSFYESFARAKMGWIGGKLKDENPELYALAKAQILALGYQAGFEKFIIMSQDLAGIDICVSDPEWIDEVQPNGEIKKVSGYGITSKKIVAEFRAQNTEVVALWKKLDEGFKRSVGTTFEMQLPSGRSLRYQKVRCETRLEKDKATGLPRRKTVFTADSDGRRKINYGGKLCENITQATARDVLGFHLLLLEEAGFIVLFSAHDEAILECPIERADAVKEVTDIMSTCPEWLSGCPLGAEAFQTHHYCK